jgi:hypothetical protein
MHQPIMTPNIAVPGGGDIDDTGAPGPPAHLGAAGARLWADVVRQYRIGDGAGLALVTTAAECLDRLREAQEAVREHGGTHPRPLWGLEGESGDRGRAWRT